MIFALYLMCYLFITASLGLFWVARMDLPAFDLHYLFGYCLLFLVLVHLWFQLPLVSVWLKKNSPAFLTNPDHTKWKPKVKTIFLIILVIVLYTVISAIVNEWMRPITTALIENNPEMPIGQRTWFRTKGHSIPAIHYIHHQGDISHGQGFQPRFHLVKPAEFKNYTHFPLVTLPKPERQAGATLTQALKDDKQDTIAEVSLQHLSNVLYYASGVTERLDFPGGPLLLRAAASSGALYPNDLYVAVINIAGLKPGIYYYHPAHHSLNFLSGQDSLQEIAKASPYSDLQKNAAALIIIAAHFDRTIWKYYDRSFRYVLPDAGHILGNLTVAASALRLPYVNTAFFDDEKMIQALGLSLASEGVLSIVALGKNKLTDNREIPQFTAKLLPKEVQGMETTRLSYQLTSIQWKQGMRTTPTINKTEDSDRPAHRPLIHLSTTSALQEDIFITIKNRRSFRKFSKQVLSFNDFSGIVQQAFTPLRNSHVVEVGRRVILFVIVSQVQEIAQGVYRYLPEENALEPIRQGDFSKAISQAGLSQELLGRAAFVMAWGVDLNRVGLLHGERDYRYANLECGIGGETTYLAAQARGLGACSVGAFYDEDLRHMLKIDSTEQHILLLTAVGGK